MLSNNCIRKVPRIVCGISIIIILGIMLLSFEVAAAVPIEQWNKTFGGPFDDHAFTVQETVDGGYIIGGEYGHDPNEEFGPYAWLIKTNSNGNQQWNKTDTDQGLWSHAINVQQTADSGYIYGLNFGAYQWDSFEARKTNTLGERIWSYYHEGFGVSGFVQKTNDGGFIITLNDAAYEPEYRALIKLNGAGIEQWNKTFYDKYLRDVQQTRDGGFIISNMHELIKTDGAGNVLWNKSFSLNFNHSRQTTDGGYILVGSTNSIGANGSDTYILKTDTFGNQQWIKTFGTSTNDYGEDVQQTTDGGYIIAGWAGSTSYSYAKLIKTDASGNEQWEKTFGGAGFDYAKSVNQTSDGGYIVAGDTNSFGAGGYDAWLVKFTVGLPKTGDINGDGQVTLVDAIYLAKHVGGFSGYEIIYADGDINANGQVTLVDAIYLAKHVGGFSGYEKMY